METLYLECPCTSFPRSFARDYKETYLYPPPSTIYGMLLSFVGEENLNQHTGVNLAVGIIGKEPPISRILRKQRHHKFSKTHQGSYPPSQFSKPNFQEILTDLKIVVKVDSTNETNSINLEEKISIAISNPKQINRFGGLSLGESWALVNGIRRYRSEDGEIIWLVKDNRGLIGLPIWIDRQTTQGTFQRYNTGQFSPDCWTNIPIVTNHEKKTKSKK